MRLNRFVCLSLAAIAVSGAAAARDPISIDALSRMPEIHSISMSSDGKRIVALIGRSDAREFDTSLATWNLDELEKGPTVTASGKDMKFVEASALKSNHVLIVGRQEWTGGIGSCGGEGQSRGSTKTFVTKIYLSDGSQSEFEEAFVDKRQQAWAWERGTGPQRCLELFSTASLVNNLPLDPDKVVIEQIDKSSLDSAYFLYNLKTTKTELLFRDTGRTSPALFDPRSGKVLVRRDVEAGGGTFETRFFFLDEATGDFVLHENLNHKIDDRYVLDVVGRDEKSGKFYMLTDKFSDQVQAWMYDPKTRAFDGEALVAHPSFSIASIMLGRHPSDFNQVLGFRVGAMTLETTWVEPRLAGIHAGLKKAYPGQQIDVLDYTDDRSKVLFSTESPRHPTRYFLLVDGRQALPLGVSRSGIDSDSIGEQRWVTYPARDGLQIPGILDLPAGWTPAQGPLPTVIHPHGGPWGRDFGGWDMSGWVPFFTSRGYAVLRPQYRGTQGLGRKLWLAGDAEWGQKMQDDKDDGAAWLVKQGIADPKRIAIMGYSYGGFAAAAAVVRPNSPYVCAISGAPVTNLGRLGNNWSENRLQRIYQGKTVKGMDPMKNTDKANIPVLLFVGDRDVRTPAWHAQDFYNAVKGKVPAKFELIPDQPHSFPWYPRHAQRGMELMDDFLANECGLGAGGTKTTASLSPSN